MISYIYLVDGEMIDTDNEFSTHVVFDTLETAQQYCDEVGLEYSNILKYECNIPD